MADLVYSFHLGTDAAGLEATVRDGAGVEVDDSPVTLDGAGSASLTLPEAAGYTASASNTDLGKANMTTAGVVDLPASIGAGGGVVLTETSLYFEMNVPQAPGQLVMDSVPDGVTGTDAFSGLPAGYYRLDFIIEVAQPAELWVARLEVNGGEGTSGVSGPMTIYPDGSRPIAANLDGQLHVPIHEGDAIIFSVTAGCVDGTVGPDPLELTYAYFTLTPISN